MRSISCYARLTCLITILPEYGVESKWKLQTVNHLQSQRRRRQHTHTSCVILNICICINTHTHHVCICCMLYSMFTFIYTHNAHTIYTYVRTYIDCTPSKPILPQHQLTISTTKQPKKEEEQSVKQQRGCALSRKE